jgi:hypothetical protein
MARTRERAIERPLATITGDRTRSSCAKVRGAPAAGADKDRPSRCGFLEQPRRPCATRDISPAWGTLCGVRGGACRERTPRGLRHKRGRPSPFPAIADYAFLSNCHTGALIAPDGSVGWLCVPRSVASVFTALLDREAGNFRLAQRRDRPELAHMNREPIRSTPLEHAGGWVVVRDRSPWGRVARIAWHRTRPPADRVPTMLVRTVNASRARSRWNWPASRSSTTAFQQSGPCSGQQSGG